MSTYHSGAPAPLPEPQPSRAVGRPLTAAQICGVTVFPLLGAGLALAGMPVSDVLALLAGCGAIGAVTIAAAGGGRRLLTALAATAVRAAAGAEPGK
ncbi:hypothetical protein PV726_32715 [Streptomyces europaeiscabiei]|uniref:hypothetical protein n=1 Tax=Streptomyces europaeiscabiei TaxID=146819 RepID=UPI0029B20F95|nr:hypothetical protein [Streptomyces europaeiscabiei]MDX3695019.1 hypothetical protein [Streptomyces europaeiscabiei]